MLTKAQGYDMWYKKYCFNCDICDFSHLIRLTCKVYFIVGREKPS